MCKIKVLLFQKKKCLKLKSIGLAIVKFLRQGLCQTEFVRDKDYKLFEYHTRILQFAVLFLRMLIACLYIACEENKQLNSKISEK